MKTKAILAFLFVPIALLFFVSCEKEVSSTTGWEYNTADNGGFEVQFAREQITGPGLVLIEGGTFAMGRADQDVMYDWNNIPRRITIPSFYMDEHEIRNVDYREYLHWLGRVFVAYPDVYQKALPDTLVWRRRLAFNEPYVEYYFRHPAYNDYPVVGVSWLQADNYCMWRTDRVNEDLLIKEGILEQNPKQVNEDNFNTDAYLVGQYQTGIKKKLPNLLSEGGGEGRDVKMEDGILLPKYRLPTEAEWEYAAYSLIGTSIDERIYQRRMYPWNGHFVRNDGSIDGGDVRGQMRANFQRGRGDMMGVAGYLNDNAPITAPVDSYWPNDFGLYCMAGNVNEWVLDIYRPLSMIDVEEFRPFRGNVFKVMDRNAEGIVKEKDKLGNIPFREMTEEESMSRANYQKADNRNYMDGDLRSRIVETSDDWKSATDPGGSQSMYYQGKGDKGLGMTSLINDKSRIYKGGGWRDRAFWLSPGARRFLDEAKSTDDIGFRCAMIRVGSPTGN